MRCEFHSQFNANLISTRLRSTRHTGLYKIARATSHHLDISRHYSNIKYPLFAHEKCDDAGAAIGVYLNLITGQSAGINRNTWSPYSNEEKKEVKEKKRTGREFNIRYGRAHSHMWQRICGWPNCPNKFARSRKYIENAQREAAILQRQLGLCGSLCSTCKNFARPRS